MEGKKYKKPLTDLEFDILDELYFVTSFNEISLAVNAEEAELLEALKELLRQQFIKWLFPDPDTEADFETEDFEGNFTKSYFLATKAGLLKHNSR